MRNEAISERLREIADVLEMQDVDFKPRAYRKAARRIDSLGEDVEDVYERGELTDLEGIGDSIAAKIGEFVETGEIEYYQQLKDEYPVDVQTLTTVEGLGPKSVATLYEQLGVEDLEDLADAAERGAIADVEGFGEQTQANIREHIGMAERAADRTLIGRAFDRAQEIRERLADDDAFDRVTIVGSFRRRRPTIGDVDLLATAPDAQTAMTAFCEHDAVEEVLSQGETKSSVVLPGDLQVDLRIVDESEYGAAKLYFTGSADHNVALRERAMDRDWKLNEYGLFDVGDVGDDAGSGDDADSDGDHADSDADTADTDGNHADTAGNHADTDGETADTDAGGQRAGERLAGETEASVYAAFDYETPPPELRENTGELDAAADHELPDLVTREDVRGDLQVHTTHSDGSATVEEMARRAGQLGHDYLLVTDHGPTIEVTTGLHEGDFEPQREAVADADDALDVDVLQGVEADVTDDGLGIPDAWADRVDLLVVAMHDPPEDPTDRLCATLERYPVDVVAHPTNRRIHGREPIDLDLQRVAATAADNDVALEINAQPERLDLDWFEVKQYRDAVDFVVSTDAHAPDELEYMHLGVAQARRGWLEADDVLNTRPLGALQSALGH